MSTKRKWQLAVIGLLVVVIPLSAPGVDWHNTYSVLAFAGLILATIGSIISVYLPSSYTYYYTAADYTKVEGGTYDRYRLSIPASKHGMGTSPTIQYFQGERGSYDLVITSPHCDEKGNVIIEHPEQVVKTGKIIIS